MLIFAELYITLHFNIQKFNYCNYYYYCSNNFLFVLVIVLVRDSFIGRVDFIVNNYFSLEMHQRPFTGLIFKIGLQNLMLLTSYFYICNLFLF